MALEADLLLTALDETTKAFPPAVSGYVPPDDWVGWDVVVNELGLEGDEEDVLELVREAAKAFIEVKQVKVPGKRDRKTNSKALEDYTRVMKRCDDMTRRLREKRNWLVPVGMGARIVGQQTTHVQGLQDSAIFKVRWPTPAGDAAAALLPEATLHVDYPNAKSMLASWRAHGDAKVPQAHTVAGAFDVLEARAVVAGRPGPRPAAQPGPIPVPQAAAAASVREQDPQHVDKGARGAVRRQKTHHVLSPGRAPEKQPPGESPGLAGQQPGPGLAVGTDAVASPPRQQAGQANPHRPRRRTALERPPVYGDNADPCTSYCDPAAAAALAAAFHRRAKQVHVRQQQLRREEQVLNEHAAVAQAEARRRAGREPRVAAKEAPIAAANVGGATRPARRLPGPLPRQHAAAVYEEAGPEALASPSPSAVAAEAAHGVMLSPRQRRAKTAAAGTELPLVATAAQVQRPQRRQQEVLAGSDLEQGVEAGARGRAGNTHRDEDEPPPPKKRRRLRPYQPLDPQPWNHQSALVTSNPDGRVVRIPPSATAATGGEILTLVPVAPIRTTPGAAGHLPRAYTAGEPFTPPQMPFAGSSVGRAGIIAGPRAIATFRKLGEAVRARRAAALQMKEEPLGGAQQQPGLAQEAATKQPALDHSPEDAGVQAAGLSGRAAGTTAAGAAAVSLAMEKGSPALSEQRRRGTRQLPRSFLHRGLPQTSHADDHPVQSPGRGESPIQARSGGLHKRPLLLKLSSPPGTGVARGGQAMCAAAADALTAGASAAESPAAQRTPARAAPHSAASEATPSSGRAAASGSAQDDGGAWTRAVRSGSATYSGGPHTIGCTICPPGGGSGSPQSAAGGVVVGNTATAAVPFPALDERACGGGAAMEPGVTATAALDAEAEAAEALLGTEVLQDTMGSFEEPLGAQRDPCMDDTQPHDEVPLPGNSMEQQQQQPAFVAATQQQDQEGSGEHVGSGTEAHDRVPQSLRDDERNGPPEDLLLMFASQGVQTSQTLLESWVASVRQPNGTGKKTIAVQTSQQQAVQAPQQQAVQTSQQQAVQTSQQQAVQTSQQQAVQAPQQQAVQARQDQLTGLGGAAAPTEHLARCRSDSAVQPHGGEHRLEHPQAPLRQLPVVGGECAAGPPASGSASEIHSNGDESEVEEVVGANDGPGNTSILKPPERIEVTVAVLEGPAPRGGRSQKGGAVRVPVYVKGPVCGEFDVARYVAGGECIYKGSCWVSRSFFVKESRNTKAKWYSSIRVLPDLETLGDWLQRHRLPVPKSAVARSSKRAAEGGGAQSQSQSQGQETAGGPEVAGGDGGAAAVAIGPERVLAKPAAAAPPLAVGDDEQASPPRPLRIEQSQPLVSLPLDEGEVDEQASPAGQLRIEQSQPHEDLRLLLEMTPPDECTPPGDACTLGQADLVAQATPGTPSRQGAASSPRAAAVAAGGLKREANNLIALFDPTATSALALAEGAASTALLVPTAASALALAPTSAVAVAVQPGMTSGADPSHSPNVHSPCQRPACPGIPLEDAEDWLGRSCAPVVTRKPTRDVVDVQKVGVGIASWPDVAMAVLRQLHNGVSITVPAGSPDALEAEDGPSSPGQELCSQELCSQELSIQESPGQKLPAELDYWLPTRVPTDVDRADHLAKARDVFGDPPPIDEAPLQAAIPMATLEQAIGRVFGHAAVVAADAEVQGAVGAAAAPAENALVASSGLAVPGLHERDLQMSRVGAAAAALEPAGGGVPNGADEGALRLAGNDLPGAADDAALVPAGDDVPSAADDTALVVAEGDVTGEVVEPTVLEVRGEQRQLPLDLDLLQLESLMNLPTEFSQDFDFVLQSPPPGIITQPY